MSFRFFAFFMTPPAAAFFIPFKTRFTFFEEGGFGPSLMPSLGLLPMLARFFSMDLNGILCTLAQNEHARHLQNLQWLIAFAALQNAPHACAMRVEVAMGATGLHLGSLWTRRRRTS